MIQPADLLGNDTDADGDTLTIAGVGGAVGGSVVLNADNTVTFTPTPDFNGTAGFDYTVSDGAGGTALGHVTVTVTAVNGSAHRGGRHRHHPRGHRGRIATATLTGNDTDIDGGPLVVTAVSGATSGTAVLNGDNTVTFTPTANFNGTAGFDYTVSDGAGGTALGHVTVTVTAVNDPPIAVGDTVTTPEDTAAVIATATLTGNDTDIDGGPLVVTAVSGATSGTAVLNGDNTVTFTPTANFNGTAGFDYTVSDGAGGTALGHVTVTVTAVNDPPIAVGDTVTTPEDTAAVIATATLTGNDTDIDGGPLMITAVSGATSGAAVLNGDNTVTFTPTANLTGTAAGFDYTVSDGALTDTGHVTINITAVNDPPIAVGDTVTTPQNTAAVILTGTLTGNDTDIDGGPLTITAVSGATSGAAVLNGNNTITFTPTANFTGTAGFDYTVSDGAGGTALGHVTVTVTAPVNTAPVAVNDSYNLPANGTLTVAAAGVLTNDTDADGNPLTAVRVTGPAHGTLTLNPNGSFTYTPTSSFVGSDSFTYTANDGTTNGNTATVTITDNIKPTAVDVQATNTSGGPVSELNPNDTITFTFSEPIDPNSIVAGWNGTGSQNVVIRVLDTGILGLPTGPDRLEVYNATNSAPLPLGSVNLGRADYVRAAVGFGLIDFGATGTPSTMTISGNTVTIVLGTYREEGFAEGTIAAGTGTMTWNPTAALKDFAGNTLANTSATESNQGQADRDF